MPRICNAKLPRSTIDIFQVKRFALAEDDTGDVTDVFGLLANGEVVVLASPQAARATAPPIK